MRSLRGESVNFFCRRIEILFQLWGNDRMKLFKMGLAALCLGAALSTVRAEEADRLSVLESKYDALVREFETLKNGKEGAVHKPVFGLAPAASKVYHLKEGVTLGGYGEMVYQNFEARKDNGTASGKTDQLDFLRYVLYVGYRFSDKFLINSEVEIEHAAEDKRGEVSVEMVNVDYLHSPALNFRAGLLLLPVGFLNELHEPPIYHGTLRPNVERNIIPTTWRENGFGVFGQAGPLSYRAYLVNGLQALKDTALGGTTDKVKGFSASSGFRDGRQKGSSALAEDMALVGRLDYTGVPGLLVGGSCYTGPSGQNAVVGGEKLDARTTLWETHGEWNRSGWELRALYSRATLGDADRVNAAQGLAGNNSIGEALWGAYGQVAFNVLSRTEARASLSPFVRYERYNTQARVPSGFSANPANDRTELVYGLTYKPISTVVLKGEFIDNKNRAGTGVDQWNAAMGYLF